MTQLANVLFVLGASLVTGATIFFSFFVTLPIFKAFPTTAGSILEKIFPGYYQLSAASLAVATVASFVLTSAAGGFRGALAARAILSSVLLVLTLYSGWVLQPEIHRLRMEIPPKPESAGRVPSPATPAPPDTGNNAGTARTAGTTANDSNVSPTADQLTANQSATKARFGRLHGLSMLVNLVVMVGGIILLVMATLRMGGGA